jgi:hypothetical protein
MLEKDGEPLSNEINKIRFQLKWLAPSMSASAIPTELKVGGNPPPGMEWASNCNVFGVQPKTLRSRMQCNPTFLRA